MGTQTASTASTMSRLRSLGYEIYIEHKSINCTKLLVVHPDRPDRVRRLGINPTGKIIMEVEYLRVQNPVSKVA